MKTLLSCLIALLLCSAFQSWDIYTAGTYSNGSNGTLELKTDNTFKETHGGEWRNGYWKLRHDTIIVDERMSHHDHVGGTYAYRPFFLVKKGDILIGTELFKRSKAAANTGNKK